MGRRIWVLNLDAENELARRARPTPSCAAFERMRALAEGLRGALVPEGDAVLWPPGDATVRVSPGDRAMAWCPTPWALARLTEAGLATPHAPERAVLREANHRGWAAALGLHLPGSRYLRAREELDACFSEPWPRMGWLMKRPLGFAGRGRLRLRSAADLAEPRNQGWVERTLADDGVMVEPFVERVIDLALHGWIDEGSGRVVRGSLTRQRCDEGGQWVSSEVCDSGELGGAGRERLEATFEETAAALRGIGYHGPFNLDAFVWRDERGRHHVQPRSEVNARYSMGWAVGMGSARPDLGGGV